MVRLKFDFLYPLATVKLNIIKMSSERVKHKTKKIELDAGKVLNRLRGATVMNYIVQNLSTIIGLCGHLYDDLSSKNSNGRFRMPMNPTFVIRTINGPGSSAAKHIFNCQMVVRNGEDIMKTYVQAVYSLGMPTYGSMVMKDTLESLIENDFDYSVTRQFDIYRNNGIGKAKEGKCMPNIPSMLSGLDVEHVTTVKTEKGWLGRRKKLGSSKSSGSTQFTSGTAFFCSTFNIANYAMVRLVKGSDAIRKIVQYESLAFQPSPYNYWSLYLNINICADMLCGLKVDKIYDRQIEEIKKDCSDETVKKDLLNIFKTVKKIGKEFGPIYQFTTNLTKKQRDYYQTKGSSYHNKKKRKSKNKSADDDTMSSSSSGSSKIKSLHDSLASLAAKETFDIRDIRVATSSFEGLGDVLDMMIMKPQYARTEKDSDLYGGANNREQSLSYLMNYIWNHYKLWKNLKGWRKDTMRSHGNDIIWIYTLMCTFIEPFRKQGVLVCCGALAVTAATLSFGKDRDHGYMDNKRGKCVAYMPLAAILGAHVGYKKLINEFSTYQEECVEVFIRTVAYEKITDNRNRRHLMTTEMNEYAKLRALVEENDPKRKEAIWELSAKKFVKLFRTKKWKFSIWHLTSVERASVTMLDQFINMNYRNNIDQNMSIIAWDDDLLLSKFMTQEYIAELKETVNHGEANEKECVKFYYEKTKTKTKTKNKSKDKTFSGKPKSRRKKEKVSNSE